MSGSPGWHPDPTGRYEFRYFNGASWTGDVSTGGTRYVDLYHPGGEQPAAASGRNGLAVAAMVCGIIACAGGWLPFIAFGGLVLAVLALCLGVAGLRRSRPAGRGRGMAIAGIATGAAGTGLSIAGIVFTIFFLRWYDEYQNPEPATVEITSCAADGQRIVASGTITNVGDEPQSYSLLVRLGAETFRADSQRVTVSRVEPQESAEFSASTLAAETSSPTPYCDVARIDGPLPLDVDPDASAD